MMLYYVCALQCLLFRYGLVGGDGGDTLGKSSVAFCRILKGGLERNCKYGHKQALILECIVASLS
jgi:hypothetical protein